STADSTKTKNRKRSPGRNFFRRPSRREHELVDGNAGENQRERDAGGHWFVHERVQDERDHGNDEDGRDDRVAEGAIRPFEVRPQTPKRVNGGDPQRVERPDRQDEG